MARSCQWSKPLFLDTFTPFLSHACALRSGELLRTLREAQGNQMEHANAFDLLGDGDDAEAVV
jgi:hypothetical protein